MPDALGVTKNGGRSYPGIDASMFALADVPSPQTMRVVDAFGSVRPNMVGLMPRPAPESMMTSPSALHSEVSSAEIFVFMSPGSKGKLVVSVVIGVDTIVEVVDELFGIWLEPA